MAECLWRYRDITGLLFAYYAAIGGDGEQMSFNEWSQFVVECKLIDTRSKWCKKKDFDHIFIAVDAMGDKRQREAKEAEAARSPVGAGPRRQSLREAGMVAQLATQRAFDLETSKQAIAPKDLAARAINKHSGASALDMLSTNDDQKKSFNRIEFLLGVIMIAVNKYVLAGITPDMSDAIDRLFSVDICTNIGSHLPIPDHFRQIYAYSAEVNAVLQAHTDSLLTLFEGLTAGKGGAAVLTANMWSNVLSSLGFFGSDVDRRDATLCFLWSRMALAMTRQSQGGSRPKPCRLRASWRRSVAWPDSRHCRPTPRSRRRAVPTRASSGINCARARLPSIRSL